VTYCDLTPSYPLAVMSSSAQVICLQIFRLNWCENFREIPHTDVGSLHIKRMPCF